MIPAIRNPAANSSHWPLRAVTTPGATTSSQRPAITATCVVDAAIATVMLYPLQRVGIRSLRRERTRHHTSLPPDGCEELIPKVWPRGRREPRRRLVLAGPRYAGEVITSVYTIPKTTTPAQATCSPGRPPLNASSASKKRPSVTALRPVNRFSRGRRVASQRPARRNHVTQRHPHRSPTTQRGHRLGFRSRSRSRDSSIRTRPGRPPQSISLHHARSRHPGCSGS